MLAAALNGGDRAAERQPNSAVLWSAADALGGGGSASAPTFPHAAATTGRKNGSSMSGSLRPNTPGAQSSTGSSAGRFSPEEKNCFKRALTPSSSCGGKMEAYFQTTGSLRTAFASEGLNQLPVLKGKFYSHPAFMPQSPMSNAERARSRRARKETCERKVEYLPEELSTSAVLEDIFPRTPVPTASPSADAAGSTCGDAGRRSFRKAKTRPSLTSQLEQSAESASAQPHLLDSSSQTTSNTATPSRFRFNTGDSVLGSRSRPATCGMELGSSATAVSTSGGSAVGVTRSGGPNPANGGPVSGMALMIEFRKQLLQKFPSIKMAFETFGSEIGDSKVLTKMEWRRVLQKHGFVWSVSAERNALFDLLDMSGDGNVSCNEFHVAVEAAAPVRTVEDLRQRWIASGYGCMLNVINILDDHGQTTHRRLTLREFGEALSRVRVTDPSEYTAIFSAVCNDGQRISIGELASAIAMVSPCLLLEDLRDRFIRKHGSLEKAFWTIDTDRGGDIDNREWYEHVVRRLGMNPAEAKSLFRIVDVDGNGAVSQYEFFTSLKLSEPYLLYEDLRRKVRQRFRSIRQSFEEFFQDNTEDEPMATIPLDVGKIQEVLTKVEMSEDETSLLFEAVDVSREGKITANELLRCVRHFAPSTVLEELRLACFRTHTHISDAFDQAPCDKAQHLDFEAFRKVLGDMHFPPSISFRMIFDLLDFRMEGAVSIGRLVAALKCGSPGSWPRLPPEERDQRAKQDACCTLAEYNKKVVDLRSQIRMGPVAEEAPTDADANVVVEASNGGADSPNLLMGGNAKAPTAGSAQSRGNAAAATRRAAKDRAGTASGGNAGRRAVTGEDKPHALTHAFSAPRLKTTPPEELAPYGVQSHGYREYGTQQSWNLVWDCLKTSPGADSPERAKLERDLSGYYQLATYTLSHDMPLNQVLQKRYALHLSTRAHVDALRPAKARALAA